MFKPFTTPQPNPRIEEEMLKLWQDKAIFERSMKQRKGNEPFVFYEGPPTANGKPGIHHVLSRTFKDIICRYQTMKGRYVLRKAGWDTHGLPVELQVEKALNLTNKADIEKYGVAAFNAACKDSVWQYKEEWERLTQRIGYWTDLNDPYITYSSDYIESVWWAVKQIWEKGLIYQDYKVVPYCPRCGTALSLAEVAQGYRDVNEESVYIKFKVKDQENTYILAWTTTPWTLPGNVGLAFNPDITYVKVKQREDIYYLAKERLSILNDEYQVVEEVSGSQLEGITYEPLFAWLDLGKESGKKAYTTVLADFVTTEDGTGIVHTAVMYGEEDFALGKQYNLPAVHTVADDGRFNQLVEPWQGRFVKETEPDIITYLQEHDRLYKTETITHTYPFCWRCSTPLLYYARTSWFIRITDDLRSRLVELNKEIKWVPDHVQDGRFGHWLAGLRDWAISRERYWGTPLPIWICTQDKTHQHCVGSYEELKRLAADQSAGNLDSEAFDPHKPYIDDIALNCQTCQAPMERVPEVLDVWFDSGAMPFAQWHSPFEHAEQFEQQFPADYISEGIDQTRGWFNSLLIISTILFDQAPYRSVVTPNLILDEHGKKMSKSKGNVVDPWAVANDTGIDALRFYFVTVNQPGDNKNFSIKAVQETYRKSILIWWNVTNFFLTYAAVDQWSPEQKSEPELMDRWILALAARTAQTIDDRLANLDMFTAGRALASFIDDLSTWYLRRSRKRRDVAFYQTMHQVLRLTAVMAAPFMPFMAEYSYQAIKANEWAESVHLADWPTDLVADQDLLDEMVTVRELVTLGLSVRAQANLKIRQPLAAVAISGLSQPLIEKYQLIIADELNVKSVTAVEQLRTDWPSAQGDQMTVSIDPVITPELKQEGILRDLVRELQELRKKAGCKPGQLVHLFYKTESSDLRQLLDSARQDLMQNVTAASFQLADQEVEVVLDRTVTIDGAELWLGLQHVE